MIDYKDLKLFYGFFCLKICMNVLVNFSEIFYTQIKGLVFFEIENMPSKLVPSYYFFDSLRVLIININNFLQNLIKRKIIFHKVFCITS